MVTIIENPYKKADNAAVSDTTNIMGGNTNMENLLGAGAGGFVGGGLGALLSNGLFGNGMNGWGGRGNFAPVGSPVGVADFALDANTAGRINGLELGVAGIRTTQDNDRILNELESMETDLRSQIQTDSISLAGDIAGISNGQANLATAIATGNFTTLTSINGLGRDITTQQTQAIIQSLNTANLTNSLIASSATEIGRDQTNATNAIISGQTDMRFEMAQC